MLQIRKILLRGPAKKDALVKFDSGANVLAGESDTGKSYLLACLHFILGADELDYLEEGVSYTHLLVEFINSKNEVLTLSRERGSSKLSVHRTPIDSISGPGDQVASKRQGKSKGDDVTSVLLPFCDIPEAKIRRNADGDTQRLTIRLLSPLFLIDEVSIIDKNSLITGKKSFDETARKRALSFILTGQDDAEIQAAKRDEVVKAGLRAKIEVLSELLEPLESRFQIARKIPLGDEVEAVDVAIQSVLEALENFALAETGLQAKAQNALERSLKSQSQLMGFEELLTKYHLLDERYESDLHRLDFINEGSYYFGALQDVPCPVCEQAMPLPSHSHELDVDLESVRKSAVAEATKIQAHRSDLKAAIDDLQQRKLQTEVARDEVEHELQELRAELSTAFAPHIQALALQHQELLEKRSILEGERSDRERLALLSARRNAIQTSLDGANEPARKWDGLDPRSLRKLCDSIESVLEEWSWKGNRRVEFDEKVFDIIVDGKPRQAHGKGVRAVLYSAFAIGLLRYCAANGRPHPGVVVIDSPLTAYKKKGASSVAGQDEKIDPGVEAAFWNSLINIPRDIQVVVLENKEPPREIAEQIHYEWFAGTNAVNGERSGFIPK